MSLTKTIIKFAAPVPRPEKYERYLFIGPHPDDIEIGAGATAAKLAAAGKTVCFLICQDGRYGENPADPELRGEKLIQRRKEEAKASAALLGVSDVRFLGLCDGGFYEKDQLISQIAQVVLDFKPQVIFAPDPCVDSECHIDHLNVGEAARQIACFAPYRGIMEQYLSEQRISAGAPVQVLAYYMTARPNCYVGTAGYLAKQLDSIFGCHISQFPAGSKEADSIRMYLKIRALDHGLRSFKGCAEGFRVLGTVHMHCLPEAGL